MRSSAQQHPKIKYEYHRKTSERPHHTKACPVEQTSAWTPGERRHKVESSAQWHPEVRWKLVIETAGEEQLRLRSVVRIQGMRAA